MRTLFLFLAFLSLSSAFTIESYHNHATVLPNGDIHVYENITFMLDQQYNEGYRSIRPADAPGTEYVDLHSVYVNGKEATAFVQVYEGNVEIVWKDTYAGKNVVELDYTLEDRTELFNDFARVCYEHFGANWKSTAKKFSSSMTLPSSSTEEDMHFEIYSAKKGTAEVQGMSIVTGIEDVPSGNYVGGCYLFSRDSVNTSRTVNGSAYEILTDERKSYGSEAVLEPGDEWKCFCLPALLLSMITAAYFFMKKQRKKLGESILPPGTENPAVVAAIVHNTKSEKDLLAATLIDLINRGFIDIVELEKKGESSASINRERTILIKKKEKGLEKHEQAVMDMIFHSEKKVDLDAMAKELKKIRSQTKAKAHHVSKALKKFGSSLEDMLASKGLYDDATASKNKTGMVIAIVMFGAFFLFMCSGVDVIYAVGYYIGLERYLEAGLMLGSIAAIFGFGAYSVHRYLQPTAPKGYEKEFEQWDAFARSLKHGRIKKYPPSSVAIWGSILVYATALGLADKVKKHLSELDEITLHRIEEIEKVRVVAYPMFISAREVSNLGKYGNRQGFSSRSSGGWSSSGGGGFSGGSSGGGGFR
jgi:uncharacterized membrane protein